MTRQEILTTAYNKLRFMGLVSSQKDLSVKLGYNYTNLSQAFNGKEAYLTDNFLKRMAIAFPVLNPEFLKHGRGSVLLMENNNDNDESVIAPDGILPLESEAEPKYTGSVNLEDVLAALAEQCQITKKAQEQTDKALQQIDQLIDVIKNISLK